MGWDRRDIERYVSEEMDKLKSKDQIRQKYNELVEEWDPQNYRPYQDELLASLNEDIYLRYKKNMCIFRDDGEGVVYRKWEEGNKG